MPPTRARARAIRTARVVTLGLALTTASGCDTVTSAYCDVFSGTETCCARLPGRTWNATTHTCDHASPPPFVGPMVPPPS